MRAMVPLVATMTAENPGESSSTLARRAWATQKSSSASLSLMRWGSSSVRCAADDVHLENRLRSTAVYFLALPDAEGGV